MAAPSDQIRLLLVEDVPQVAQYVRSLLNAQTTIKLLDVLTDGRQVEGHVQQLRPDVLVVDALLQGRVKGLQVAENVRRAGHDVPIVILTVPQNPVHVEPSKGVDKVLSMPFSGYDLINLLTSVHKAHQDQSANGSSRVVSVFAPKGGVGTTTLAFNLAVALGQGGGIKTVLIDGSIQFGDLRALLKVPAAAPSILDLPTDRIAESDLTDVLWRDPSGIDILLAPPRVEMAEMVTTRDVDKTLSLLRRVYGMVVIDTPSALNEVCLAFLDASDVIVQVLNYESTTLRNTANVTEAFKAIGYPPTKVRYLVNRSDSNGGIDPAAVAQMLGRQPEYGVVSDGRLVVESNNQGVPFVLAHPEAPISRDIHQVAASLAVEGAPVAVGARR